MLEAEIHITFTLKEGVLHGDGMIKLFLRVVDDNDAVVTAVVLIKKLFDTFQEKFVRFLVQSFGGYVIVEFSLVDHNAEHPHPVLFKLGVEQLR